MFKPKTFAEFTACMQTGALVTIGMTIGYINAIEREDGSGRCWIVTIAGDKGTAKEFVRTE